MRSLTEVVLATQQQLKALITYPQSKQVVIQQLAPPLAPLVIPHVQ
jgi:hypothetical protein